MTTICFAGFIIRAEVESKVSDYIDDAFGTVKNATTANATLDQFIAVNSIQTLVECCG